MREMSNGEDGVDLKHVLFMPMEPLQSLLDHDGSLCRARPYSEITKQIF
jgi:hypothetical protein